MRMGDWKGVETDKKLALYDLKTDPDELTNLFGDPAFTSISSVLAIGLDQLRETYLDDTDTRAKPESWRKSIWDR